MKPEELAQKYNTEMHPQMINHLGIEFIYASGEKMVARMPVDKRTVQPMGLLHGGASCVLAETLGSIGATLSTGSKKIAVGVEINANHLRSATSGYVTATSTPVKLGGTIQVWECKIESDEGKLVCVSRLTVAMREPQQIPTKN